MIERENRMSENRMRECMCVREKREREIVRRVRQKIGKKK